MDGTPDGDQNFGDLSMFVWKMSVASDNFYIYEFSVIEIMLCVENLPNAETTQGVLNLTINGEILNKLS